MGESTSQYFAMRDDVLPGMREVHWPLPGHDAENIERQQHACGVKLGVGMLQEVGNHIGTMPVGMRGLEDEAGVFLFAFGREADIVELDFVGPGFGCFLGERDVVFLHFRLRRIGPDQFAVLTPRLARLLRFHRQFGMRHDQSLVAEDGDSGDGMHALRMQEANVFRQIMEIGMMAAQQRMIKRNVDDAVAVLDIEDHGVSAHFAPVLNNPDSVIAACHHPVR